MDTTFVMVSCTSCDCKFQNFNVSNLYLQKVTQGHGVQFSQMANINLPTVEVRGFDPTVHSSMANI